MKNLIAIDPGAKGGIALLRPGQPAQAYSMPVTEGDIVDLLRQLADPPSETVAFIEAVGGFAGRAQPGARMFTFGRGYGFLLGVLQTLGVRTELIRPAKWQKAFSLGTASACKSPTEWKNKIKAHAQRLYPHLKITLNTSDALVLLEYGRKSQASFPSDGSGLVTPTNTNVVPFAEAAG